MRRTVSNGRMVKGIGPIAIAIVMMVGVLVTEGVFVATFIKDEEVVKRSAREVGITAAVNFVEFAKRALQQAVSYSFYAASYDVLSTGGFCAYGTDYCSEDCKIPNEVPTLYCKPWWRVYGSIYAPSDANFISYLSNRTAKIYDDYGKSYSTHAKEISVPQYCPQPPGKITAEESGKYKVRVNVTNVEGGVIEYKSGYTEDTINIIERAVNFTDRFKSTTLDLFEFARGTFAEGDWVENQFDEGNEDMPNTFCRMVYASGGVCSADTTGCYCNTTAECWTNSDKETNCWGSDCCCRKIHFGDLCEPLSDSFCDSKLPTYCRKEDKTKTDACNFDRKAKSGGTTTVTADEKYNCTMIARLGTYGNPKVTSLDDWIESTTRIENCIKVGHESEISTGESFDVDWIEWRDNQAQVQWKCDAITRKACGCEDECRHGEGCSHISCEDDGKCPADDVIAAACPPDNCGHYSGCSDRCVERECDYSESNPCVVLAACDGACSKEGGSCKLYDWCDEAAAMGTPCECQEIWTAYTDCNPGHCPEGACIRWECEFSWSCSGGANACDYECCELTYAYVRNVRCDYDYIGTANISAVVSDVENSYPIDSEWKGLSTAFYVASGNTKKAALKCPALMTNAADEASGCKAVSSTFTSTSTSTSTTITSTTTSSTTTTIVIPDCSSARCSYYSGTCKCGTTTCIGKYCCSATNMCYSSESTCDFGCPAGTTTSTSTTTTIPIIMTTSTTTSSTTSSTSPPS